MRATFWRDYLCPWCYLGLDRSDVMTSIGVHVESRPFDLHPEVPADGHSVRPGGRLSQVFDLVASECHELGIPFRRPERTPNTGLVLAASEVVRLHQSDAFDAFDRSVWDAHWVQGTDLGDRALVLGLVEGAGADPELVAALLDEGVGAESVATETAAARRRGVTATPTWAVGDLLIPGVQPREVIRRWVGRIVAAQERVDQAGHAGTADR